MLPKDLEEWLGVSGPRRLNKAAYGLAEAPLAWFRVLRETLLACGFTPLQTDPCMFVLRGKHAPGTNLPKDYPEDYEDLPIVGVAGAHVDDLLCGGAGTEWDEALRKLTTRLKFGDKKFPPVTYCGVRMQQDAKTHDIKIDQAEYIENLQEPSTKTKDLQGYLRSIVGSLIWPAHQTRPDLSFDVSSLGSRVSSPTVEDIRVAQKLVRRAKHYKDVGLQFRRLQVRWRELVIVNFSDAGWATRPSGHSQGAAVAMLCHPDVAGGHTALANILDYSSAKITLSVVSSYDAELHACSEAADIGENCQATLAELAYYPSHRPWSIQHWIDAREPRVPIFVVIDAKGLWTKIQSEYKTEKRGTIYIRRLMDILYRVDAKVYWVNSGHMVCDALTKLSTKSPSPNLDLLLHVLTTNMVRITYCEGSWRKELATKKAGNLKELKCVSPEAWNPPEDQDYDTIGHTPKRVLKSQTRDA